jgi:hypothetical protein
MLLYDREMDPKQCLEQCPFLLTSPSKGCTNSVRKLDSGEEFFCEEHSICRCGQKYVVGEMYIDWGESREWYTTGKCYQCEWGRLT